MDYLSIYSPVDHRPHQVGRRLRRARHHPRGLERPRRHSSRWPWSFRRASSSPSLIPRRLALRRLALSPASQSTVVPFVPPGVPRSVASSGATSRLPGHVGLRRLRATLQQHRRDAEPAEDFRPGPRLEYADEHPHLHPPHHSAPSPSSATGRNGRPTTSSPPRAIIGGPALGARRCSIAAMIEHALAIQQHHPLQPRARPGHHGRRTGYSSPNGSAASTRVTAHPCAPSRSPWLSIACWRGSTWKIW